MFRTRKSRETIRATLGALAVSLGLLLVGGSGAPARAAPEAWDALADGGKVIVMRHATTVPGTGDPPGFRLDDCATQRNLSDAGRREAARAGQRLRERGIRIDRVLTSAWCRSRDTAVLMDLGPVTVEPAINSFFAGQGDREGQTAAARALAAGWRGPGTLLLVTHQVNITALTGVFPRQGEMVVLAPDNGGLRLVGRIDPG